MSRLEARDISAMLAARAFEVASYLIPSGKLVSNEWRSGDISGAPGQSLGIHLVGDKSGVWADFATGESGDLLSLWQAVRGCDFKQALNEAVEYLGIDTSLDRPMPKPTKSLPVYINPPGGVEGVSRFTYTDANNKPVIYVIRQDTQSGKRIRQWGRSADGSGWVAGLANSPKSRPLYRLPIILQDEGITCIHEGEKAVMAACKASLHGIHTTTIGGAGSARNSDFTPLHGRDVCIVPDNDEPGKKHAAQVVKLATEAGAKSVRVILLPGLPVKGDVVEWLDTGGTNKQWCNLIEETPIVKPDNDLGVNILCAENIKIEPINWLWNGWLAGGKLHILAGQAGTGKTTLAMSLAAIISSSGTWPDGTQASAGSVLVWSGEDDPADSLIPRLLASGANLKRVFFITDVLDNDGVRNFDPSRDMPQLIEKSSRIPDLRLLIIDPIVSAITGDSHKNAEVRRGLQPIVDMASKVGAAVLGITHFTKGSKGADPTERVTGSLAFGALARLVMCTAKPVEDGGNRRLVRSKSNIGPDGGGFEYNLKREAVAEGIEGQAVQWGTVIDGAAHDLLAEVETPEDGEHTERDDAKEWLKEILAEDPLASKTIERMSKQAGFAWRTVQRAAKKCPNIEIKRRGFGKGSKVMWAYIHATESHTRQTNSVACMEKSGAYGDTTSTHAEVF